MLIKLLSLTALLPANWMITPVLQDTDTLGLKLNSWMVEASTAQIEAFKRSPTVRCTPLTTAHGSDWHCLDENHLYSLLQYDDSHLWVESQRIGMDPAAPPSGVQGVVISHYRNAFEQITILRSSQHLFAVYSQFERHQRSRGARLVMEERDSDTFVQQWQRGASKWTLTGQRESDGSVSLVYTQGTTQ
jgi:hypothetical protein